jgi:hypothetical protein
MWARALTLSRLGERSEATDTAIRLLTQEPPEEADTSRTRALIATLLFPERPEEANAYVRAMVDAFCAAGEADRRKHAEVLIASAKVFIDAGMRDAALVLLDALIQGLHGDDVFLRQMRVQAHLFKLRLLSANGEEVVDRYIALARDELAAVLGDSSVDELAANLREAARSGVPPSR